MRKRVLHIHLLGGGGGGGGAQIHYNNNNNNNNDFIYRGNSVGVIQSSLRSSLQHSTYVHKDTKQQKNKIYKII